MVAHQNQSQTATMTLKNCLSIEWPAVSLSQICEITSAFSWESKWQLQIEVPEMDCSLLCSIDSVITPSSESEAAKQYATISEPPPHQHHYPSGLYEYNLDGLPLNIYIYINPRKLTWVPKIMVGTR